MLQEKAEHRKESSLKNWVMEAAIAALASSSDYRQRDCAANIIGSLIRDINQKTRRANNRT